MAIVYHTPFPGPLDPFYLHNPEHNDARTDFYGIPYVPWVWADGVLYPWECIFYHMYQDVYDQRKAVPTDVSLTITGTYNPDDQQVMVSVTATTAESLPAGDYRLHIVLTEDDLEWEAPNGQTIHRHVMRRMYPDAQGTQVSFTGDLPQSARVIESFALDPQYVAAHCRLVVFLQEHDSHEVYQAASTPVLELEAPTGVPEGTPAVLVGPNYPNPFNPRTTIEYTLAEAASVRVAVYDLVGRRVCTLVDEEHEAGRHETTWNGTDAGGTGMPTGTYLVRAQSEQHTRTWKIQLVR